MKSDKDPAGSQIAPLLLKPTKQGKHSVKLNWNKPAGAVRYVVYGNVRGAKYKMTRLAEVTGGSYNAKKIRKTLKTKTYHKFIVVALDRDDYVVSTSKLIFASTKGSKKLSNPKAAIVKAKVNAKGKKIKKYKTLRKTVLKKGKCRIYIYAQNGAYKTVTITVK